MSVTNLQLITDALRGLNVIRESQTPNANQQSHCLRQLNQMMSMWESDQINLQYYNQTDPGATCPIPEWAEQGVTNQLAIRIAGDYGADPLASIVKAADDGMQTILRAVIRIKRETSTMQHLPQGSGRRAYNIITGD